MKYLSFLALWIGSALMVPAQIVTYGYTTYPSGAYGTHGADYHLSQPITIPQTTPITHMGVIFQAEYGNTVIMGIYTDNSGVPGTLLGQTLRTAVNPGITEVPLVSNVVLTPGTYWYTVNHNINAYVGEDPGDPLTTHYVAGVAPTSLPATMPATTSFAYVRFGVYLKGNLSLPVEILSFEAAAEGKSVDIRWEAGEMDNFEGFGLERSADGANWEELTFLTVSQKAGDSYNWTDHSPRQGVNLYRLRLQDLDGAVKYTGAESVLIQSGEAVSLYPNPGNGAVTLRGLEGEAELSCRDLQGREVAREILSSNTWNPADLPAGYYMLHLRDKNGVHSLRYVRY